MLTYSVISYTTTKNRVIETIHDEVEQSLKTLQNNTLFFITSFAVNEYEKLIFTEISHQNFLAIIIEDNNMGKIMGKDAYVTGMIKTDGGITTFEENNQQHVQRLQESYYSKKTIIRDIEDNKLGTITIHVSDKVLNEQLLSLLIQNILVTLVLILVLISTLFLSIRKIIYEPLINIIAQLQDSDADGIPSAKITKQQTSELNTLSSTINNMISTISSSRKKFDEQHKLLQMEQSRFQLALEGSQDGIWDWNPKSNKVFYSSQWKSLLGYQEHEIGSSFEEWRKRVHPDDLDDAIKAIKTHLARKTPLYEHRYRMQTKDGSWKWILARGKALFDDTGEAVRVVGFHTDLTHDIENQIAADNANKAKSLFLATMSHEIRTPLTGVLGMAELLHDSQLNKEQSKQVNEILDSGRNLLNIINDILDFSKISSGKLQLDIHPFKLKQLIEQVLKLFEKMSVEKGINLIVEETDLEADSEQLLLGDSTRLRQVLINLIGNAVKFTSHGEVKLSVISEKNTDKGLRLRFKVSDSGIGISEEQQLKLFDAFYQANQNTTRKYGGSGLGLAISQSLVTLMGGVISVHSSKGKGSTFEFCLTFDKTHEQRKKNREAVSNQSLSGKILIVDDVKTNLMIAKALVKKLGLEVQTAANGKEAVELCQQDTFDLIFMDCRMPIMDGYQASRLIRESKAGESLPIIALTANATAEERQECFAAGMNEVLTKPYQKTEIYNTLHKYLG
jgi:PAS domain S-box-containing protein